LSLFLSVWRLRIACNLADADPESQFNPWTPHLLLLTCFGLAVAGFVAFCTTCTVAQAPFTFWMTTPEMAERARPRFYMGFWISLPIGTAAGC